MPDALRLSGLRPAGIFLGKVIVAVRRAGRHRGRAGHRRGRASTACTSRAAAAAVTVTLLAARRHRRGRRRSTARWPPACGSARPPCRCCCCRSWPRSCWPPPGPSRSRSGTRRRGWLALGWNAWHRCCRVPHARPRRVGSPPGGDMTRSARPSRPLDRARAARRRPRPGPTGSRILGVCALVGIVATVACWRSRVARGPARRRDLGQSIRIMYVHVPHGLAGLPVHDPQRRVRRLVPVEAQRVRRPAVPRLRPRSASCCWASR